LFSRKKITLVKLTISDLKTKIHSFSTRQHSRRDACEPGAEAEYWVQYQVEVLSVEFWVLNGGLSRSDYILVENKTTTITFIL